MPVFQLLVDDRRTVLQLKQRTVQWPLLGTGAHIITDLSGRVVSLGKKF